MAQTAIDTMLSLGWRYDDQREIWFFPASPQPIEKPAPRDYVIPTILLDHKIGTSNV